MKVILSRKGFDSSNGGIVSPIFEDGSMVSFPIPSFDKDNDLQVIWGYLQVGEIIENPVEQEKLWWHPHSSIERRNNKTNMIITATKTLSFDNSKPGAGLLKYDVKRVLTLENNNKATWKYNTVYDLEHILSNRRNSAKNPDEGIYYAGIWQELGLAESKECLDWAESIVL